MLGVDVGYPKNNPIVMVPTREQEWYRKSLPLMRKRPLPGAVANIPNHLLFAMAHILDYPEIKGLIQ